MRGDEKKTVLHGSECVGKDHPRIELRGEIDSLYARAVYVCAFARQYGYTEIISGLEDIVRVVRELMRAEALDEPPNAGEVMGMEPDELRHVSHHTKEELGLEPYMPDEQTDEMTALINLLRTDIRRTERAAVAAGEYGAAADGVQLALNRLSSAAYILMLENYAKKSGF